MIAYVKKHLGQMDRTHPTGGARYLCQKYLGQFFGLEYVR